MQLGMLFMNKKKMKYVVRAYSLAIKNILLINPRVKVGELFTSVMNWGVIG